MESITIHINTKNAAFDPHPEDEVMNILEDLVYKIARGDIPKHLIDGNGNTVGTVEIV